MHWYKECKTSPHTHPTHNLQCSAKASLLTSWESKSLASQKCERWNYLDYNMQEIYLKHFIFTDTNFMNSTMGNRDKLLTKQWFGHFIVLPNQVTDVHKWLCFHNRKYRWLQPSCNSYGQQQSLNHIPFLTVLDPNLFYLIQIWENTGIKRWEMKVP